MKLLKRLFCKHSHSTLKTYRYGYGKHGALTLYKKKCNNCGKTIKE